MQLAAHGHVSGTGPPARRTLLGSSRYQHQQQDRLQNSKQFTYAQLNGRVRETTTISGGKGAPGGGSTVPQKRKLGMGGSGGGKVRQHGDGRDRRREMQVVTMGENGGVEEGEEIRCRCGSNVDDGFSIACDGCGRWCHAACFGIQKESVPEEWICWVCAPQSQMQESNLPQASTSKGRRRTSISAGALRASTAETSPPAPTLDDLEDERSQYVHIEDDFIPQETTQRRLRAYATAWRGVSALGSGPPPNGGHTPFVFGAPPAPCPTVLQPAPSVSSRHGAAVLPINYALHAATAAPSQALLARFPSTITPSSAYLRAPTNGYAHIGAPKRFVHLVGPPLDVALDARCRGGSGRWVRSGCWPNAELRAYVCGTSNARKTGDEKGKGRAADLEDEGDDARTHFGIFATRELRQGEEIVVGWEWDDANAVHRMGTLAGGMGPTPSQRHLIAQLANILHSLGDAKCACACAPKEGVDDGTCVIRAMEDMVFPPVHPTGSHVPNGEEMEIDIEGDDAVPLSPLLVPRAPASSTHGPTGAPVRTSRHSSSDPTPSVPRASCSGPSLSSVVSITSSTAGALSSSAPPPPPKKPKRLAGPGVPPPSPEGPDPRWGPLIGAARGVCAAERVVGSGGWGGLMLDQAGATWNLGDDSSDGDAAHVAGEEYAYSGFGATYANGAHANTSSGEGSASKDYVVLERGGGWDVLSSSAASRTKVTPGWETEEDMDVDVVGYSDSADMSSRSDRVRGKTRRREPDRARNTASEVQEKVVPPKSLRKRWTAGADGTSAPPVPPPVQTVPPPTQVAPPGQGKGRARIEMDVDAEAPVDANAPAADADARQAQERISLSVPPLAPPPLPSAGTSPSASFARLTLVSPLAGGAGLRPAWVVGNAEVNADVLGHNDPADVYARRDSAMHGIRWEPAPNAAPDADQQAAADVLLSLASADVNPSPRPPFVEPAAEDRPLKANETEPVPLPVLCAVCEDHEDPDVLIARGAEEPYRPSPASPSPEPQSDSDFQVSPEIPPRELEAEVAAAMPGQAVALPPPNGEALVRVLVDPVPPHEDSKPISPAREPTPPPPPSPVPPHVVKVPFKEWQARKKQQRLEETQARELEAAEERARERDGELEGEREYEQVAPGEDKENEVVPLKVEDGLTRILDGIRRSALIEKPLSVELPVRDDLGSTNVVMPSQDTSPVVHAMALDEPSRQKTTSLSLASFSSTGHDRLSPLIVLGAFESRTPSPGLANDTSDMKREAPPLVVNGLPSTGNDVSEPMSLHGLVLPSPVQEIRILPPSPSNFTDIIHKPAPLHSNPAVASRLSSPSFATNGALTPAAGAASSAAPTSASFSPPQPSTPPFGLHARVPSREEGEISSPPTPTWGSFVDSANLAPRTLPLSSFVPSGPPTQPRSHHKYAMQRLPPSAPKALREAQNSSAVSRGNTFGGRGWEGQGPLQIPPNVQEPRTRGGRQAWRKPGKQQRPRG